MRKNSRGDFLELDLVGEVFRCCGRTRQLIVPRVIRVQLHDRDVVCWVAGGLEFLRAIRERDYASRTSALSPQSPGIIAAMFVFYLANYLCDRFVTGRG